MIMEFIKYLPSNTIEVFALIIFIYSIFNFKIKEELIKTALLSLAMSTLSYIVIKLNLLSLNMLIQFIILVLFFKIFLKRNWIYALWMPLLGLVSYGVLSSVVIWLCAKSNYISFDELNNAFFVKGYIIQVLSASILTMISAYVNRYEEYFNFTFRKVKGGNVVYIYTMTIVSFTLFLSFAYYISKVSSISFILFTFLFIIFLSILLYYSIRRDRDERNENLLRISCAKQKKGGVETNEKNHPVDGGKSI